MLDNLRQKYKEIVSALHDYSTRTDYTPPQTSSLAAMLRGAANEALDVAADKDMSERYAGNVLSAWLRPLKRHTVTGLGLGWLKKPWKPTCNALVAQALNKGFGGNVFTNAEGFKPTANAYFDALNPSTDVNKLPNDLVSVSIPFDSMAPIIGGVVATRKHVGLTTGNGRGVNVPYPRGVVEGAWGGNEATLEYEDDPNHENTAAGMIVTKNTVNQVPGELAERWFPGVSSAKREQLARIIADKMTIDPDAAESGHSDNTAQRKYVAPSYKEVLRDLQEAEYEAHRSTNPTLAERYYEQEGVDNYFKSMEPTKEDWEDYATRKNSLNAGVGNDLLRGIYSLYNKATDYDYSRLIPEFLKSANKKMRKWVN